MTSNLQELKEALYKDFDTARDKAELYKNAGSYEGQANSASYMQTAARDAQAIIAIEREQRKASQPLVLPPL